MKLNFRVLVVITIVQLYCAGCKENTPILNIDSSSYRKYDSINNILKSIEKVDDKVIYKIVVHDSLYYYNIKFNNTRNIEYFAINNSIEGPKNTYENGKLVLKEYYKNNNSIINDYYYYSESKIDSIVSFINGNGDTAIFNGRICYNKNSIVNNNSSYYTSNYNLPIKIRGYKHNILFKMHSPNNEALQKYGILDSINNYKVYREFSSYKTIKSSFVLILPELIDELITIEGNFWLCNETVDSVKVFNHRIAYYLPMIELDKKTYDQLFK